MKPSNIRLSLLSVVQLGLALVLGACTEKPQEGVAQMGGSQPVPAAQPAPTIEKGMYFKPELKDFALHNEYDADGDGDGVNETHVRRYIHSNGSTAFSMTTNGKLWAWSLDTKAGDDSDIHSNYVIRDSNCDGVFDERYSLDAEFHVPVCVAEAEATDKPGGI